MAVATGSMEQGGYFVALDGMRGLFFLCILTLHVLEVWNHLPLPPQLRIPRMLIHWSWMAVDMFFVLSGFLITGLLMRMRGVRYAIRTFYFRRALRIFPPYYLLLAAVFTWMVVEAGTLAPALEPARLSYWVYLQNLFIAMQGWDSFRPLSHLWSLAVEEQFYLLWPLLVLMLPMRQLRWILIGMLVLATLLRAYMVATGDSYLPVYVLLFTRLDDLAAGSLLALAAATPAGRATLARWSPWAVVVGFAVAFAIAVLRGKYWLADPVVQVFGYSANIVIGAGLIAMMAFRERSFGLRVLFSSPALVWLGIRSYAAYLFHWPIAIALQRWIEPLQPDLFVATLLTWGLTIVVTLLLAELSWRYWETPWRAWRKWYQPGKPRLAAEQPAKI